jgi:hypothetical protein
LDDRIYRTTTTVFSSSAERLIVRLSWGGLEAWPLRCEEYFNFEGDRETIEAKRKNENPDGDAAAFFTVGLR